MSNRNGRYDFAFGGLATGLLLMLVTAVFLIGVGMIGTIHARREQTDKVAAAYCKEPKGEGCETLKANVRAANANEDAVDVAVWALGMGAAGLIGVGFTVLYAQRAFRETRRSADAAHAAGRAYVFFHDAHLHDPSALEVRLRIGRAFYQISWKNFGSSPAIVTGVRMELVSGEEPPDPRRARRQEIPAGAVVHGAVPWPRGAISKALADKAFEEETFVYLCGEISYRDAFGGPRHTWYCRRYTGSQFILDDLTDWSLNGYD